MKKITKNILTLTLSSSIFILQGCSSKAEVISVSEAHLYNQNYGLQQDAHVDNIIQKELLAINQEARNAYSSQSREEIYMEKDTFLAEDFVKKEPIITYKYKFDKKFYDKAEWRSAEE